MATLTCLLVSEEQSMLERIQYLMHLVDDIAQIHMVSIPEKAIENINQTNPDLIFIDMDIPGKDVSEFVSKLRSMNYNQLFIFISKNEQNAMKAIKLGAFDFLVNPIDIIELKETISRYRQTVFHHEDQH